MGMKAMFGHGAISGKVAAFEMRLGAATIHLLNFMGESLVQYAKEQRSYTDQTGNLTNSIGYVVTKGNVPVIEGGIIQHGEGYNAALNVALQLAKKTPTSYSLIIVAGMNYAAAVEAKGFNVILPAELKAKKDFPAAIMKLKKQAESKAEELFGIKL